MAGWQSGYAAAASRGHQFDSILAFQYSRRVAKLVDTRDLKSLGSGRAGSSPAPGTLYIFS